MQRICIVGPGRVGGALAIALTKAGYDIGALVVRDGELVRPIVEHLPASAQIVTEGEVKSLSADIVLLTVPDTEIAAMAEQFAGKFESNPIVIHTSGALDSNLLEPFRATGSAVASMHPLASISDAIAGSRSLKGKFFCIEGDEAATSAAVEMVTAIGGRPFTIETTFKPLYHASAVMAAGNVVALFSMAAEMLVKCGVDDAVAAEMLMPLTHSALDNIKGRSIGEGITGSFARFDAAAFDRHLASLDENVSTEVRDVFLLLGERAVLLAAEAQDAKSGAETLLKKINMAKGGIE